MFLDTLQPSLLSLLRYLINCLIPSCPFEDTYFKDKIQLPQENSSAAFEKHAMQNKKQEKYSARCALHAIQGVKSTKERLCNFQATCNVKAAKTRLHKK